MQVFYFQLFKTLPSQLTPEQVFVHLGQLPFYSTTISNCFNKCLIGVGSLQASRPSQVDVI